VPDSQFKFFTHYHHLKDSKLDDSVVALLRLNGRIGYQTKGGWWSSKKAMVVKDDGASENYVGRKFIDELKLQWAALQAKEAGWMIVETANIKAEDGIKKHQRVKFKLLLGASYVHEAEFMIHDIKGFDIGLGKRWMRDINQRYQIDHDSNGIWIADNLWEDRGDGRVHCLPGLRPLDVDEEIVKEAEFLGIHIIPKPELKNVCTRLLKRAFWITVHHRSDRNTLPTEPPGELQDMLKEFQGLFGESTCANLQKERQTDFEIKTDPNGKIPLRSSYSISPREEEELRRQIPKGICSGYIQPCRSNFGSAVLFLRKPDGMLRMCIDYCAVNAMTVKDCHPLPHIEDLLNSMHGFYWFTKLDLAAGSHQIRIATADRQRRASTTKFDLYEWRVLPFVLANAPSQFIRMMNGILEPMKRKFIIVYLDNIMIHSRTMAEHVILVREVLTLLMEHGLKAKCAKCAWACQKVDFWGFDIDKNGIYAQEHKTRAVMHWPQPENSKDVRGFLGLTSYYRIFIEHYADIAMPLYAIGTPLNGNGDVGRRHGEPSTVQSTLFAWDRECQHASDTHKRALCNAPVLALPDPEAKYWLHIEGSQYAFGAVLSQMQGKAEKVLGYFSCKLHNAETRYPAYDRELLGIWDTILYWKFNLHGAKQPFLVHTDHATLRWILTQPHLTVRQMDILTVIQNFDWEVKHIAGVKNQVVDTLSRSPNLWRERCNVMAMEGTAAGEWIEDIKAGYSWRRMVWAYCTFLGLPKSLPPAIHLVRKRTQIMGVSTTILFGRECPTVVTRSFGKETGGEKGKGKEEGWRGRGDNGKSKREGGKLKGREGGRGKGREERMVVYSKDDVASNPPGGPRHSSRGTLQCEQNVLRYERPVFLEANVGGKPVLRSRLRHLPSNQLPERETHWPPTTTSCSQRPLAKNQHWLYNQPAGFGKWPRLHCNVCGRHDK